MLKQEDKQNLRLWTIDADKLRPCWMRQLLDCSGCEESEAIRSRIEKDGDIQGKRAIERWLEYLEDQKPLCVGAISPLHDCDRWPDDGEDRFGNRHKAGDLVEPHYHLLLKVRTYRTLGTLNDLGELLCWLLAPAALGNEHHAWYDVFGETNVFPAIMQPMAIRYPQGAFRILTHMDNYGDSLYPEEKIVYLGGVEPEDFKGGGTERALEERVSQLIRAHGLTSYARLLDLCDAEDPDLGHYAKTHTAFLCAWLESLSGKSNKATPIWKLNIIAEQGQQREKSKYWKRIEGL